MNVISLQQIAEVRQHVGAARREGRRIGLVPTMGALHEGHLSLVEASRRQGDFVVVTIFVNPTQFGPNEDYGQYPRRLEADLATCRDAGVDLVFHPAVETIYPPGFSTSVDVAGLASLWEGAHRPGHFRGVTTVVLKLLNIALPDVAYFGQKDFQQQLLIRRMCDDLNVPVAIRTCPIIRESDGLALSSRNSYLSAEDRAKALVLFNTLQFAKEQVDAGQTDIASLRHAMQERLAATPGVEVDYATIVDPQTLEEINEPQAAMIALIAARVGKTRLIDNMWMTDSFGNAEP